MIEKPTITQIRPLYQYLRKQAENKKAVKYIEVAATFILIAVFLFFAIKPTALAISSLLGEIKSKELASQKMRSKIGNIIQAQDSFSQAQEKYSILESGFPSNPHFYQAAINFSSVSKQSSINIKQLNFDLTSSNNKDQKKDNPSLTQSYQINLSANSQYQQSLLLIRELINNRRLIDISSIRFSQPDKNQTDENLGPGYINLNINSNLYYSPIKNEEN